MSPHTPGPCQRVGPSLYNGKTRKALFACPVDGCGRATSQNLNVLGRRVVMCDGVKFTKMVRPTVAERAPKRVIHPQTKAETAMRCGHADEMDNLYWERDDRLNRHLGGHWKCRQCNRAKVAAWTQRNPDRVAERQQRYLRGPKVERLAALNQLLDEMRRGGQ